MTYIRLLLPIIFLLVFLFPNSVQASNLSLSPGTGSIGVGQTRTFQVRLTTQGEGVNAVTAIIAYPQDLLDVISVTPGGAFSIQAEQAFGNGEIRISRGNIAPVSGIVTVATIQLKGKTPGKATVYFTIGSAAPRATDSSDSLKLSESVGAVIDVGNTVQLTDSKAQLFQVGYFEQTLLFLTVGFLLTTVGFVGTRVFR